MLNGPLFFWYKNGPFVEQGIKNIGPPHVWKLWCWRNKAAFDPDLQRPAEPLMAVKNSWRNCIMRPESDKSCKDAAFGSSVWSPPPCGWIKLNIDGAMDRRSGMAGCGGAFRDPNGTWMAGFSHDIGLCSAFEAEECALFKG
ncbi:uncharacterized protein LOC114746000 [Neltuma alba]|uniref:uncharacterized protein LOC114734183 n=1 Tax=Neltuma alba TaxID=207710 RepID=UPI0010A4EF22|nr:uncharacterized protein LOC114734183 [Prosopis alba]XP_028790011.1 uncharacterized protein LOC114746000 [Prosopis alba]